MSKVFDDIKPDQGADVNQALTILGYGKPCLYFNNNIQIIDCDDAFVKLVNISKKDLIASRLVNYKQNKPFTEAIQKAGVEGIAIFRGNVFLGTDLSGFYLESILYRQEAINFQDQKIICLILESKPIEPVIDPALDTKSSLSGTTDYPNAAVSLHTIDGNALYISPSTEELLGYTCAELKDMNPLDVVYSKDVHIVKDVLEKLIQGYNYLNSRYRMVRKNGSVIHVESVSYVISDVTGNGKHIVNVTCDLSLKLKMDRALQRSEQKYYRLVMNLPTGISLISTSGQLMEVNDAMRNIMGLPPDFPMQEVNFFSNDVIKHFNISVQLNNCIEHKEIVTGDITFKASRKKPRKFLTYSFVPVFNSNKEVDIVIGYVSDLTKQMKAEVESRERAEFLNLVINAIKTPFFLKNEEHKWVMLNDAAIGMMGQPRESLIGKSDYDLYSKEQADVFWKYDEMVFKTGSSSNEEQITWSDGTLHTIVTYKQLYIEKPTGKKFIVGTIHDISNYKKIEGELRASELDYHELFDNANDFILTTDLEGNITNANRTLLNYLETDLENLTQHSVFDFISEEYLAASLAIKDKILAGLQEGSFEINAIGMNGQPVVYEIKANLIRRNNVLTGVQCVFSDVTERREASLKLEKYNADLLELNTTKDKFFSIIAHDLRNPFSSMIGFSEMLLEDLDELSKDDIRDSIKIIYSSAKNSFNLLDNLLTWSRLETGHMHFDPTRIDLAEAVEEVVEVLFSLAYRKKIGINNMVEPDIILFADQVMLNIILNNLIMNAIKFTPVGGKINIYARALITGTESGKEFIKISIADTGIGIDPETSEKLFAANILISSPGTEKEQGTGLGLILVREMVEMHGGKITVDSTPGKGSVFSFLIPAFSPNNIT